MNYATDTIFIVIICLFATAVYITFRCINVNNKQKNIDNENTKKIQTITGSWLIMLSVLFGAYVLGEFTTALLVGFIGIKSLHEISLLHQTDTDKNSIDAPQLYTKDHYKSILLDCLLIGCVFLMSILWLHLNHLLTSDKQRAVLLFMLFVIQCNDVHQYVAGTTLGHKFFRRKLMPTISPNKTIEGALFGSLATGLLAIPFGMLLTDFSVSSCFLIATTLAVSGVMGDLLQSAVKRRHHVKDMGHWIKGHGGIMDRVDSLLLAVPIFYIFYTLH